MSDPILSTKALSRRFGGLYANSSVDIALEKGFVHAVLGTSGTVRYKGRDITRMSADRRSRLGIGRSYQKTNIFPEFTAFENCRLAAQSRTPRPTRIFTDALSDERVCGAAREALEATGLAARADRNAGTLSHGEQRQLEIAMVL